MEPTSLVLLLSLLIGTGLSGYVATGPHDRVYRATRGSAGAISSGWASGRTTAGTAFSKPPGASQNGSSIAQDVGWFFKQCWAALKVGRSFVVALRSGYRTSAESAMTKRLNRRAKRAESKAFVDKHLPAPSALPSLRNQLQVGNRIRKWTTQHIPNALLVGATTAFDRISRRVRAVLSTQERQEQEGTNSSTDSAEAEQEGDTVSTAVEIPSLTVVQEFTSPGQMEEPLEDLKQLAEQIAQAMRTLVEGMHDFINGYADASFTTGGLTLAISSLVEAVEDDGQVNVFILAEKLPPVAEAIEEAKTLGEAATQLEAEGDVEGFKES